MITRRTLHMALALALAFVALAPVSAFAAHQEPPMTVPEPIFTADGPEGVPGAWIWLSGEGTWLFVPAQMRISALSLAAPSDAPPAWPSDATKFWVQPAQEPGSYWVWDVFVFAGGEEGPSVWAPAWRLVSGSTPLGF